MEPARILGYLRMEQGLISFAFAFLSYLALVQSRVGWI